MTNGETNPDLAELTAIWPSITERLPPNERTWLSSSKLKMVADGIVIIAVPNAFSRTQIEGRARTRLEDGLSEHLGRPMRLVVEVDPDLETPYIPPQADHQKSELHSSRPDEDGDLGNVTQLPTRSQTEPQQTINRSGDLSTNRLTVSGSPELQLNPRYQFETFVIGQSNRFAHAAAAAVAEAPGRSYNPLMIYGDSGLGKTHLLHAIGHYVANIWTGSRIRYVSSEAFTNDVINSIQDGSTAGMQRRYRDVDLLLIDDIQFLEGKQQTQEEFFHTFNALHNANKQIVITSDRPPKHLTQLEDRLRNRFEWGLLTDVQPPDLETRIAILRKKQAADRLSAPADVLEFIASRIQTNIRELEGALIRVTAFASINNQDVDLTLAEIVLKDLIPEGGEPEVTAGLIMAQTANYFGFTIDDLTGPSRVRSLTTARQIAMYLCRELTPMSLPKIGEHFGGRDHT
ncbi:MAG TPA: chromosomal replication initiator protein DnaA, partial [Marmoricola sp.]|nr:chromosomal replication initiator protein DnaA [Marmoricola sp.]